MIVRDIGGHDQIDRYRNFGFCHTFEECNVFLGGMFRAAGVLAIHRLVLKPATLIHQAPPRIGHVAQLFARTNQVRGQRSATRCRRQLPPTR